MFYKRRYLLPDRCLPSPAIDPTLSYSARGLLIFLSYKPDGWKFKAENLVGPKDSLASVQAGLDELSEIGFVYEIGGGE